MFKISFLLILLGVDSRYTGTNLNGYEKSSTVRTKRNIAVVTRKRMPPGRETLFQDEVFGHVPESGGTVRRNSWREDRNGTAHVSNWLKRCKKEGTNGLETRSGRGGKPIMGYSDEKAVRCTIEQDRQSVDRQGRHATKALLREAA